MRKQRRDSREKSKGEYPRRNQKEKTIGRIPKEKFEC